jgi:pleiotropic regulator 1
MWDWNSGTAFQNLDDIPQPGSLDAEAGVFCSTFDMTGTRLITGCADKTIKVSFSIRVTLDKLLHLVSFRFILSRTSQLFLLSMSVVRSILCIT